MTDTQYNDATPEEVEASRMIDAALAAFMDIAAKRSIEWIRDGRQTFGPEHWLMMICLHCVESARRRFGGKLPEEHARDLVKMAHAAAEGTPLLVMDEIKVTHKGPVRAQ